MPGFLGIAAPMAPVPLSLAAAFGAPAPAVSQEQRPLSLADALAADEEDATPPHKAGSAGDLGKGDAAPTPAFTILLEKDSRSGLGLNVSEEEREPQHLRIDSVCDDGAAEAWNRRCAQSSLADSNTPEVPSQNRALGTGDRIISVNSVAGDAKRMLQECKEKAQLKLTIKRAGAGGSVGRPSALRADADVFVPSSAPVTTVSPSATASADSPLLFGGSPSQVPAR
uniref:PDZ domain-containing protein n=1 Tax=Strombidinopsis acuminata TaxID=141414 RepID=A0A7S3WKA1_9SPIT